MHEKLDHLFVQKFKAKKTLNNCKRRNKLPLSLLSLLLHKLSSDTLQLHPDSYMQHFLKRKIYYPFKWIQLIEGSNCLNMNSCLHLSN